MYSFAFFKLDLPLWRWVYRIASKLEYTGS